LDGRWDSVALDVAWRVWSTAGGRGQLRLAARYDPLHSHRAATLGTEATWRPASGLALVGIVLTSLGETPGRDRTPAWQSVGMLVRARSRMDTSVTAGLRYDAVKRAFRMELMLSGQ
jgi:hypothetical protein